jgi:hypothetical protein
MDMPAGATPEESQTDTISDDLSDQEILALLGLSDDDEEEPTKPFGNQKISEDEAVEMDR